MFVVELFGGQRGLALMTEVLLFILLIVTLVYQWLYWRTPSLGLSKMGARISFLWGTMAVFILSLLYGTSLLILYLWFLAFLALKEYLSMTPTRRTDRRVLFFAYLSLPIQFILILLRWKEAFTLFVPIYVFLVLPVIMVLLNKKEDKQEQAQRGFLQAWSTLGWGIITTVYSLGFLAYLLVLPSEKDATLGGTMQGSGLFLFLVGMAQLNHATQFLFGKYFNHARLSLKVSTTRNWASLIGSVVVSTLVGWLTAPWFTPFGQLEAALMGAIIAVGAFIGYIILSAIKHDLQWKDRGTMTPGRGGILNRIDTFIYTAPLFYYLVHFLHY